MRGAVGQDGRRGLSELTEAERLEVLGLVGPGGN